MPLDAPLFVEVKDWRPCALLGRAADGRGVTLDIAPAPAGHRDLDVAVLVDHSGSMESICAAGSDLTMHAAVVAGLRAVAGEFRASDRLHLWEFGSSVRSVGICSAHDWPAHVAKLSAPHGGTEIGGAIDAVLASRAGGIVPRDIIVMSDGMSHALDVQRLATSGARITVVLIGEDSLDARVGYLAALTGGEIFVPAGTDVAAAIRSALRSARTPAGDPREGHLRRSGMTVRASWTAKPQASESEVPSRAVAAYAASLLLTALDEQAAARLAEAEGLVTHLTSLVLVDEDGARQEGLPATRKVALPSPRTMIVGLTAASSTNVLLGSSASDFLISESFLFDDAVTPSRARKARNTAIVGNSPPTRTLLEPSLSSIASQIDWAALGADLAVGDLSGLPQPLADAIQAAAADAHITKMAKRLALTPVGLVLRLMARSASAADRHAARVDRALLSALADYDFADLQARLGLSAPAHAAEYGRLQHRTPVRRRPLPIPSCGLAKIRSDRGPLPRT